MWAPCPPRRPDRTFKVPVVIARFRTCDPFSSSSIPVTVILHYAFQRLSHFCLLYAKHRRVQPRLGSSISTQGTGNLLSGYLGPRTSHCLNKHGVELHPVPFKLSIMAEEACCFAFAVTPCTIHFGTRKTLRVQLEVLQNQHHGRSRKVRAGYHIKS